MIYEYRCNKCDQLVELTRTMKEMDDPVHHIIDGDPRACKGVFKKVITQAPSVPFEHLRNADVFERHK